MGLPAWAWLVGVVFWSLVLVRMRRRASRRGGADLGAGGDSDGPLWAPGRRSGGF